MKKFIDENRLKKLCKLAKIDVKPNEVEKYLNMLNDPLSELEILNTINTEDLEPLLNPYEMTLKCYSDVISDGDVVDELMKNAPKELYNYFVVPKVIES